MIGNKLTSAKEVMTALLDGHTLRVVWWDVDETICLSGDGEILVDGDIDKYFVLSMEYEFRIIKRAKVPK